ncbi:VOC family protein [Pseudarthrobacter sp. J64]|uniref:VOC family protein n=1 Tax=Pseudarthrobacter sp. J64 TaxID=3116485 RepID=UPI002E81F787|nr:VOC family protein [Pseudarthrobacter sp. J64]MEE2570480.1 VOC family protein [Pseudarthrobacter sp. J64]
MPTPDLKPGSPCWIDLMTSDTAKSRDFYGQLFGWEFQEGDQETYGGYIVATRNGQNVGGIMAKQEDQQAMPDMWSTYLKSDDAAATSATVQASGGQVFMEPMEVPEQGVMGFVADPSGATIGIWESKGMPGFGVAAEPGAPAWHELHTKDYDAAVKFYQDVFNWHTDVMSDSPDLRYTTLGKDDTAQAGIIDASGYLPEEIPSHWAVYFAVADADATIASAVAMGATVLDGPENSPFGRVATLNDPTGAMFKIVGENTPE